MEIIERENVNVESAVIVKGLTLTETDSELETFLQKYGSIRRNLIIDDQTSEFHHHGIVEYAHSTSMLNLTPLLPLTLGSLSNPSVTFQVRALASVCKQTASGTVTEEYLETLKALARGSGKPFLDVLQGELEKLQEAHSANRTPVRAQNASFDSQSVEAIVPEPVCCSPMPLSTSAETLEMRTPESKDPTKRREAPMAFPNPENVDCVTVTTNPTFPASIADPPGIQRMVVEHIVKTADAAMAQQASVRLRVFSGRSPRPPNEPDFDTWRASVDLLLSDPSVSDLHRARRILDSLLPPAADVVKHVRPPALPAVYLELLESVYGSVEDGDELLAKFMGTLQNQGEKSSDFLHRLQVILSTTIRRGGIAERDHDRCLLKQFMRGCWDNGLIASLQLGRREVHPPTFAELVVLIRTEEGKHASKEERMRNYLGLSKAPNTYPRPRAATQQVSAYSHETPNSGASETDLIKKQLAEVQAQVANLGQTTGHKQPSGSSEKMELSTLRRVVEDLRTQVTTLKASMAQEVRRENSDDSEIVKLRQQVAELQAQNITQKSYRDYSHENASPRVFPPQNSFETLIGRSARRFQPMTNRPRPGYCFRCGEDGHLAVACDKAANPARVEEKRRKLREQQAHWDSLHDHSPSPLN